MDYAIADLVGNDTYIMLWNYYHNLFKKISGCNKYQYQLNRFRNSNSNVTDFLDLHIDSDYKPHHLKKDLVRIISGNEPTNKYVKKLVGSSFNRSNHEYEGTYFYLSIIFIVVYWFIVIIIIFGIIYGNDHILPKYITRS